MIRFRERSGGARGWRWRSGGTGRRLPCACGHGGRQTPTRRRGPMPLPMRWKGCRGRKPRVWPAWSARRCVMPWCATTPRGVSGLSDRPRTRPSRLTEGQQAALRALILRGPDPERDGISSWTRADIAALIEAQFGHRYHVSSLSKILRKLGFSRQKARPSHPHAAPKARAAWLKKGAARMPGRSRRGASGQADQAVFPG